MAIQFNEIPFDLTFRVNYSNDSETYKVKNFFETEQQLFEKSEVIGVEIKENVPFELTFQSELSQAKLYMDGLDSLPERYTSTDIEGIFLSPSHSPITLYHSSNEYYPYIPGLYRIKIVMAGRRYFAWLKVIPNRMTQYQWEIMRDDVELELKGLAQGLTRKSYGFLNQVNRHLSPIILRQFMVIEQRFPAIMAAINDLYRKVNFQIKKDYTLMPREKSSIMDGISIRYRVMHPETMNVIKTPVKITNYDLPENRMVKRVILYLIENISKFILSVEQYQKQIHDEIQKLMDSNYNQQNVIRQKRQILEKLSVFHEKARKMRGTLNWMKTAHWFKHISDSMDENISPIMISDVRYRTLYQVQRELKKEPAEIAIDKLFPFQWKRTDNLYEIWGFIQFVKMLQDEQLGFEATGGWIYDETPNMDQMFIPIIPSGTTITFQKDQLQLRLIYDGKLPSQSSETNSGIQPLYTTGTNNRPDGRLDIYDAQVYIGSLLFDFKYRPKQSIWNPDCVIRNEHTATMRQLVSYAFNCRSEYLFGNHLEDYLRETFRPVNEVWAFYPSKYENNSFKYYQDHNIRLIKLSPGYTNEHLIGEINNLINKIVKRSKPFIKSQ